MSACVLLVCVGMNHWSSNLFFSFFLFFFLQLFFFVLFNPFAWKNNYRE